MQDPDIQREQLLADEWLEAWTEAQLGKLWAAYADELPWNDAGGEEDEMSTDAKARRLITCSDCGRKKPHKAHGKCNACYLASRREDPGSNVFTHGLGGYARGCKCDTCTTAHTSDMQARRTAARMAAGIPERAGVLRAEDVRRPEYTATLSEAEVAFVDQACGSVPKAAYAREALLEKAARDLGMTMEDLEDLDTVRRQAPRRPNYAERAKGKQRGEGQKR
jgi:hypothetical protein